MCSPSRSPADPQGKGHCFKAGCLQHLKENDDLTLEEHREAFEEEFGQAVSTSTIARAIASLPEGGWSIKKSRR
jgi:transposase